MTVRRIVKQITLIGEYLGKILTRVVVCKNVAEVALCYAEAKMS